MKIFRDGEKSKWIEWGCLLSFLMVPFLLVKLSILFGFYDIWYVSGWESFYEKSWGAAHGYSLAIIAYWFFSPLVIIWLMFQSSFQEISVVKAIVIIIGCGAALLIMLVIAMLGPPISSIETPTKGIRMIMRLGRTHLGFCMMYGGVVFSCVTVGYCWVVILWRSIIFRIFN